MVEHVGGHAADDAPVVCPSRHVREQLAEVRPTTTVFRKMTAAPEQLDIGLQEREALAFGERFWGILPVHCSQLGLWIEEVQLTGPPSHVQVDDRLGPRW